MRVGGGGGDFYIQGFFFISKKVNLYNFLLASLATSSKFAVNLSYILNALNGENFTSF